MCIIKPGLGRCRTQMENKMKLIRAISFGLLAVFGCVAVSWHFFSDSGPAEVRIGDTAKLPHGLRINSDSGSCFMPPGTVMQVAGIKNGNVALESVGRCKHHERNAFYRVSVDDFRAMNHRYEELLKATAAEEAVARAHRIEKALD